MKKATRYGLNRTKFLSEEEALHLETLCKRRLGTVDTRDALLMLLAIRTGGRAQELLGIRVNDFEKTNGTIYIRGIKGSNDREIPVPEWLAIAVERYIRHAKPESELFPIGYFRLRQIWMLYRPVEKKFHCLRHTFAMRTYLKTKDVRLLQVAMGHRSILNTMIYVDYVYSTAELRKIL